MKAKRSGRLSAVLPAVLLLLGAGDTLSAQTAEEIIHRLEANEIHDSSRMEAMMRITDRYGVKTAEFTAWGRGRDLSLIEFTSGEERGQKILRTSREIYLYYPDAEEVIRLQGAALRESVLGSDLSYQDLAGDRSLLDSFKVRLSGSEEAGGRDCYRLELEATARDIAYPRQTIWVDREDYVARAGLYYALSGRLLKELKVLETLRTGGKIIPSRMVMEDKLKGNSSTEFIIRKADLAARIPASKFSLEELSW